MHLQRGRAKGLCRVTPLARASCRKRGHPSEPLPLPATRFGLWPPQVVVTSGWGSWTTRAAGTPWTPAPGTARSSWPALGREALGPGPDRAPAGRTVAPAPGSSASRRQSGCHRAWRWDPANPSSCWRPSGPRLAGERSRSSAYPPCSVAPPGHLAPFLAGLPHKRPAQGTSAFRAGTCGAVPRGTGPPVRPPAALPGRCGPSACRQGGSSWGPRRHGFPPSFRRGLVPVTRPEKARQVGGLRSPVGLPPAVAVAPPSRPPGVPPASLPREKQGREAGGDARRMGRRGDGDGGGSLTGVRTPRILSSFFRSRDGDEPPSERGRKTVPPRPPRRAALAAGSGPQRPGSAAGGRTGAPVPGDGPTGTGPERR